MSIAESESPERALAELQRLEQENQRLRAELRQARKEQLEQQSRHRSFIEHTTDGVWCYEFSSPIPLDLAVAEQAERMLDCTLVECNDECARSYGCADASAAVGQRLIDLFKSDRAKLRALFTAFIQGGYKLVDGVGEQVMPDGSRRVWLNRAQGVIEDGQLVRAWGTFRDVTERERARQALQQSEERFRVLVEATSDWIWEVNADGVYTYSSPKVCGILGRDAEEVVGMTLFDLMPPEEAQRVRSVFAEHAQRRAPIVALENRNLHQDGHIVVLETSAIPLLDGAGNVIGYRGIDRDISRRKRTEAWFRAQHELAIALSAESSLSAAAQHLLDAACQLQGVDSGGVYIADRQTGELSLVHHRGLTSAFVRAHSHYPRGSPHAQLVLSPRPIFDRYCRLAPHLSAEDEAEGLRAIAVVPIHYGGEPVGVMNLASHVVDDFTASVRQEIVSLAVQMSGAIYRVVAEEERRSLQSQVLHSQKLESLGVLAGGIAHDFNNLLVGILGNASLILADLPLDSPARPSLEDIEATARRAADLVRQMLAYSGKGHFIVERVHLPGLVQEMVQLLEISIAKNVSLKLDLAGEVLPIEADATQLRQIVLNLITNASEALEGRSGVIAVSAGTQTCDRAYLSQTYFTELQAGRYSFIEVTDSGCGMDPEITSRIFDPFFSTKFTGRGLGLAAVLGIVRGHHGAIRIQSERGRGTTVRVLFPVAPAVPSPAQVDREQKRPLPAGDQTILLVDDEETVRTVASRMLQRIGFEVVAAKDGCQALELFQASPDRFALVILDLAMPRMGGEECFAKLCAVRPGVRVVLSSGYGEQELTERYAETGFAGFLQKPYRVASLERMLKDVLPA